MTMPRLSLHEACGLCGLNLCNAGSSSITWIISISLLTVSPDWLLWLGTWLDVQGLLQQKLQAGGPLSVGWDSYGPRLLSVVLRNPAGVRGARPLSGV